MTIKNYTTSFMLFASLSLMASEGGIISNAGKNDIRYIKDIQRMPDVAYQQQLREQNAWKNFTTSNGSWYVVFNEENAKPHRAFGQPISVFGMDAQSRALNFITNKLAGFNMPLSELTYSRSGNSANYQYVHFDQTHGGVKVLNSDVFVKMTPAGQVITFGCDVFNDIAISTSPTISGAAAITFAKVGLADPIISSAVNANVFILPIPEFKQNTYKLVYEVTIDTKDATGVPAKYYTLVDATDGKILYRENKILHFSPPPAAATDITISGTVYPTNPYSASVVKPLRNLKMVQAGTPYYTDSVGYIGLSSSTSTSVIFSLEGLWSRVLTAGVIPTFTATANPGTNTYSFDANANIREQSAYYHVNIVHDYMKTKFPAFTGLDNPLPTNVDLAGTCNAFYDGTSINFYALGGGCNSLAQVGDVIYHEYGHGINDKFYISQGASFGNGSMGEGYADIWAIGITGDPVLGIGFDAVDPTVFVRRYDINKKVYPQDLTGEVHANGEIIAGAWWDTNLNLGTLQGMMDLYKETFYATLTSPDGTEGQLYTDILIEALTDDDVPANGGDNNISNGTPNDNSIVDGFALHGITLLSNAVVTHVPVTASIAAAGIPINATVAVTYPWALAAAKVFYKINRLGAWTGLSMTNTSGISYTATIPAQPQGTVIGYYIALEGTTGILSAVQPVASDLANPNIPYYILNGASLMMEEDFDLNFGGWGTGIAGDNATTGLWVVDIPIGSYFTPGDLSTAVQPGFQNTPGGAVCALTGNASSTSDALGTNDVDGGSTTLESPINNLASYTNPIITYDRWYVNNPPSGANPGNDYWETQISNDGTTWVKIERTNVSDRSWRRFAFRVKDYVTLTATIQMRFIVSDSLITGAYLNGGSLVEGALDNYYIYEEMVSGIAENASITAINVFPNPATNSVAISYEVLNNEAVTMEVMNNLGQVVYTQVMKENAVGKHLVKLETSSFAEGMYLLKIKTDKKDYLQKIAIIK
jgi:Zn-dependent metalloprotease